MLMLFIPTEAEAAIYEDTLRLHILPESDTAADQALKIHLRDKVLEKYSPLFSCASDTGEAIRAASESLKEIEADCNSWILDTGSNQMVKVSLAEEWYETRKYSGFTLPAGVYASLKIEIGKAEGQNWWCVMYPPMCLEASLSEGNSVYTPEEVKLISKSGYRVKFKILELASAIIEG